MVPPPFGEVVEVVPDGGVVVVVVVPFFAGGVVPAFLDFLLRAAISELTVSI